MFSGALKLVLDATVSKQIWSAVCAGARPHGLQRWQPAELHPKTSRCGKHRAAAASRAAPGTVPRLQLRGGSDIGGDTFATCGTESMFLLHGPLPADSGAPRQTAPATLDARHVWSWATRVWTHGQATLPESVLQLTLCFLAVSLYVAGSLRRLISLRVLATSCSAAVASPGSRQKRSETQARRCKRLLATQSRQTNCEVDKHM